MFDWFVSGLCGLSGVIILSSEHGHVGTFCNDGSFTTPVGHPLVFTGEFIFVKYNYDSAETIITLECKESRTIDGSMINDYRHTYLRYECALHCHGILFNNYKFKSFKWRLILGFTHFVIYLHDITGKCPSNFILHISTRCGGRKHSWARTDSLQCGKHITFHVENTRFQLFIDFQIDPYMEWHNMVVGFEAIYSHNLGSSIIQDTIQYVQHDSVHKVYTLPHW